MSDVLPDRLRQLVRAAAPAPDETLVEMHEYAEAADFPHVGPEVGATLRLLARMVDAQRVFEFGSGFGYSAYWFAGALPADGEVVLTEVDADELDMARDYLAAGGYADRARFELGDALVTVETYDGPFDAVLIDNEKHRYVEAFEAVRSKVPEGGVVIADNAIAAGPLDTDAILAHLEGDDPGDLDESTAGIVAYLDRVRADPAFETVVLPLGEGIAVSYRIG